MPELVRVLGEMKLEQEQVEKVEGKTELTPSQSTYTKDKCPACEGEKINTARIPTGSVKDRIFPIVFGLIINFPFYR